LADCHDRWQGLGRGYFGPVSGEPLHTAAYEAAHVVQQLGGQEGEPIGHEKNIASLTSEQCQGACYVHGQGKDKLDGFFTQSGSAAELQALFIG